MDSEGRKFGRGPGPRELTGAVDLITHYKLLPLYEFFCKKSLPVSIADTHYLHNVVGDTEIRKGEGMQLDQLIQNPSYTVDGNTLIRPFNLDSLRQALHLRETTPVELPSVCERLHLSTFNIRDIDQRYYMGQKTGATEILC